MRQKWRSWFVNRQNCGLSTLAKQKSVALAKQIFHAWDFEGQGFLTLEKLSEQLIGLGLATST